MLYDLTIGNIRIKSVRQPTGVYHELRHYASVLSTFTSYQDLTFLPGIVEQHYSFLVSSHRLAGHRNTYSDTQKGVDIALLYKALCNEEIDDVCAGKSYRVKHRNFNEKFMVVCPELTKEFFLDAFTSYESPHGRVYLTVELNSLRGKRSTRWTLPLPPDEVKLLRARTLVPWFLKTGLVQDALAKNLALI